MIWQFILFVSMLGAGLLILSRHMEGYREEAGQIASGTAGIVGILLIITGFGSVGDDETIAQPAKRIATRPVAQPAKTLPAPQQQAVQIAQAPAVVQLPATETVRQYDLGVPGAAYQRVEAVMLRYKDLYGRGVNEIQQTELRFARGKELCALQAPQYAVAAKLVDVSTNKEGDARASFVSANGVEFIPDGQFARGSAIHTALANLAPGSMVAVLFTFEADGTGKDCFHSNRWTEVNNMTEPRWDVNVLGVTALR